MSTIRAFVTSVVVITLVSCNPSDRPPKDDNSSDSIPREGVAFGQEGATSSSHTSIPDSALIIAESPDDEGPAGLLYRLETFQRGRNLRPRPDLNGAQIGSRSNSQARFIILDGKRCWIDNPGTHDEIYRDYTIRGDVYAEDIPVHESLSTIHWARVMMRERDNDQYLEVNREWKQGWLIIRDPSNSNFWISSPQAQSTT